MRAVLSGSSFNVYEKCMRTLCSTNIHDHVLICTPFNAQILHLQHNRFLSQYYHQHQ